MKAIRLCILLWSGRSVSEGFYPLSSHPRTSFKAQVFSRGMPPPPFPSSRFTKLFTSIDDAQDVKNDSRSASSSPQSEEEKAKAVGNLIENDEWLGLTLELSELVRTAVIEDVKTNAREFLGKDNYELGDISKEIDSRVKTEVARMRGKAVSSCKLLSWIVLLFLCT
jgi:hypothetical protein